MILLNVVLWNELISMQVHSGINSSFINNGIKKSKTIYAAFGNSFDHCYEIKNNINVYWWIYIQTRIKNNYVRVLPTYPTTLLCVIGVCIWFDSFFITAISLHRQLWLSWRFGWLDERNLFLLVFDVISFLIETNYSQFNSYLYCSK